MILHNVVEPSSSQHLVSSRSSPASLPLVISMTLPSDVPSCLVGPIGELMKYASPQKIAALPDEGLPLTAAESEACLFRTAMSLELNIGTLAEQKVATDPDGEDDRHKAQLKQGSEHGFDMREPLGQKFRRSDGFKSPEYVACTTITAKRKFRQDWATGRWQEACIKRMKTESWQEVGETKGQYMPIRRIIKAEGDDEQAVLAATRYVDTAIKMAGKFISYNEMTERWEFLYFTRSLSTSFTKCWQIYCEQQPISMSTENGDNSETSSRGNTDTAIPRQATLEAFGKHTASMPPRKAPANAKSKANQTGKAETENWKLQPSAKKSPLEQSIAAGVKTKALYFEAMAKSSSILKAMANDELWQFLPETAKVELAKPLRAAVAEVETKSTSFMRDFCMASLKDIRKTLPPDQLETECVKLPQTLDGPLKQVLKETTFLINMGMARAQSRK